MYYRAKVCASAIIEFDADVLCLMMLKIAISFSLLAVYTAACLFYSGGLVFPCSFLLIRRLAIKTSTLLSGPITSTLTNAVVVHLHSVRHWDAKYTTAWTSSYS